MLVKLPRTASGREIYDALKKAAEGLEAGASLELNETTRYEPGSVKEVVHNFYPNLRFKNLRLVSGTFYKKVLFRYKLATESSWYDGLINLSWTRSEGRCTNRIIDVDNRYSELWLDFIKIETRQAWHSMAYGEDLSLLKAKFELFLARFYEALSAKSV